MLPVGPEDVERLIIMAAKREIDLIRLLRRTELLVEKVLQHQIEPPYTTTMFQKAVSTLLARLSEVESSRFVWLPFGVGLRYFSCVSLERTRKMSLCSLQ